MAGDDLVVGGISVRGAATLSTSVTFGPSTFSITGMYVIRISTYQPVNVGAATGLLDKIMSTALTFSTNDILGGVTHASTYGLSNAVGLAAIFPTSSGALGFHWINGNASPQPAPQGPFLITVFRTT